MKEQFEALVSILLSAWRFRWSALCVAWAVVVCGTLMVLGLPNKYESSAQIYVDTRSVLRPLLQGLAVTAQTQDQADAVRRALLARPTLDVVARKVGLYKRTSGPTGAERLLTSLSTLISIHGDTSLGIYTITYSDASARTAQAVVQTLLDTFVEKTLGAGHTDTQNAESFLSRQVKQYETALLESEQRLADFKKKNVGLMPDQRGDYFGRLQAELANREKVRTDLTVALRQRDELVRKISGQAEGQALLKSPPTDQEVQAATSLDARIRENKKQLDELLLKYTDHHPEVLALKDTIARLEQRRRAELGGVRQTNGTTTETSSVPVDPVIQNLQIARNDADVRVAALQAQAQQADERVSELQRVVTTGPEVEAELVRLNRNYGVNKTQYEALLQRLETARLSNEADRSEDHRFKVLEPPLAPLQPVSPNRLILILGVMLAAGMLGIAVALVRSLTQPVFFSKQKLASATGLPVIGVVSLSRTPEVLASQRRRIIAYAIATAVLVGFVIVVGLKSNAAALLFQHALGRDLT